MNPSAIHVGLLQHACPIEASVQDNVDRAEALAKQAVEQGAELLITQELFGLSYFPQIEDEARFALAEAIPGPTSDRLVGWAKQWNVWVSGSIFEKRAPGLYHNTSILIAPSGEIVGMYRKMHIPDDPRFYEKYYFTPGDLGFQSFAMDKLNLGMLVCWDQWYPEAARLTAMQGAHMLAYPTAIGWYHGETEQDKIHQRDAWQTIQRSHAIANGVYVVVVNRVGVEDDLTFWGSSFVAGPSGEILAQASEDQEEALVVECDLSKIEAARQGWPFFRDRRIDAFGDLTKRWLAD